MIFLWPVCGFAELPWVAPEGSFTAAVAVSYGQFDQFFVDGSTKYTLPGEVEELDIAILANYSATERLSLGLLLPISYSRREFTYLQTDGFGMITGVTAGPDGSVRDVDNNPGLGDTIFSVKYLAVEEPVSLGFKTALKVPGTYDETEINAPGDGQTDLGFGLLIGKRVTSPVSFYIGGDLTFVGRFGKPSNQLEFSFESGVFVTTHVLFRIMYDKVEQFGGENLLFFGEPNDFPALDEDYDKLGVGLGFRPQPSLDIFATATKTIHGSNTADELVFTVGVSKTF